ncbi:maspardin-like [Thrips palmi]|uniref:Maspardin n=1 Tax=Thrips palmi TaxID=161013 RepID=A0A6P8ZR48_THRPL|nr:maspardin-like [Thrips palmi]
MSYSSEFAQSPEYSSFRSSIPQQKVAVDSDPTKEWKIYDSGPKSVKAPLVCLPPVSGTADIFFKQVLALGAKGIRVIAAEHPVYWTVTEWCDGFRKLMDHLGLQKVHIFGTSLGGFLAQKFAERTSSCPRVASLILCNTFMDTSIFNYNDSASLFWMFPSLLLKKMIMGSFTTSKVDAAIADSIDFMVERLESLSQQDLASRLTMNCVNCYVEPHKMRDIPVTIVDVFDEYALSSPVREELYKCYPSARLAHLKSGGNFPYLSRSDQVNVYLQIHLRGFQGTPETPWEASAEDPYWKEIHSNDSDIMASPEDVPQNVLSEGQSASQEELPKTVNRAKSNSATLL